MSVKVDQVTSTERLSRAAVGSQDGKEREKNPAETVTRLHRAILRLAFSFHGQNAKLDAKLADLAKQVRAGQREALSTTIDDVISTILALDISARDETPQQSTSASIPTDAQQVIAALRVIVWVDFDGFIGAVGWR